MVNTRSWALGEKISTTYNSLRQPKVMWENFSQPQTSSFLQNSRIKRILETWIQRDSLEREMRKTGWEREAERERERAREREKMRETRDLCLEYMCWLYGIHDSWMWIEDFSRISWPTFKYLRNQPQPECPLVSWTEFKLLLSNSFFQPAASVPAGKLC